MNKKIENTTKNILDSTDVEKIKNYLIEEESNEVKKSLDYIDNRIIKKYIKLHNQKIENDKRKKDFTFSARDSFGHIYIALISIIEGLLLKTLHSEYNLAINLHGSTFVGLEQYLQIFIFVLSVILVWNEYRMGVSSFKWTFKLIDSFIPFLLAVIKVLLIKTIFYGEGMFNFYIFLAMLWLSYFAAYWNMYYQSRKENISYNKYALEFIKKEIRFPFLKNWSSEDLNKSLCLMFCFINIGFGIIFYFNINYWVIFTVINILSVLSFLVRGEIQWKALLREIKGEKAKKDRGEKLGKVENFSNSGRKKGVIRVLKRLLRKWAVRTT